MPTEDELEEAAKAFWGPLKPGVYYYGQSKDISISVPKHRSARAISLRYYFVAGHWSSGGIDLLQLCSAKEKEVPLEFRETIARLLYHIVAEARQPRVGHYGMMGPPNTILDMVSVEHDERDGRTWLIGETYDDRVEIKSEWEPEPFRIGDDGLHARWMDGYETWLELSAEPTTEYERVFKVPIEKEEVPEMPLAETGLDKVQAMIDNIEREIRQLRAKEHDFTSSNTEIAHRLGKRNEYEELLRQRDEHMWRENPASEPPHGSPGPPILFKKEWFDEDGRNILPEHEEEFMDFICDKFWRGDTVISEHVSTKGAFMGRHEEYERMGDWTKWDGEYDLGINRYGPTDPSLPTGMTLLAVELHGVEVAAHVAFPLRVKHGDEVKIIVVNRLYLRAPFEQVAKAGRTGWIPESLRLPLPIAIDKVHFMLRKLIIHGGSTYPILNWVQVETMTRNGVEPDMNLVAISPDGQRIGRYSGREIPSGAFQLDIDKMMGDRKALYIELEEASTPRPGSAAALEKLMFDNRISNELSRIFDVELEPEVEELPIEETEMGTIQERLDIIEREIRVLRAKERDFDSSNTEVAARLGKREEYDRLLRQRDEAMWRGNPCPPTKTAS